MTSAADFEASPSTLQRSERARTAAAAVNAGFGHRLLALPPTWIGAVVSPRRRLPAPWRPWHYWWQAHYLDCLVDAGRREWRQEPSAVPASLATASRLLGTIRLRNFLRFTNSYFDDMAWLALAAERTARLGAEVGVDLPTARRAVGILGTRLVSAHTPELGGGVYWNTKRDFKNTPATAPAALFFARTGRRSDAESLVEWLVEKLLDPDQGLFLDGLRIGRAGVVVERAVYTYNQGPVLGALLELGGSENLERAAALVGAVDRHLTVDTSGGRALITHGGGDGGLFTGILVRYLAETADDDRLAPAARATARQLVLDTADAFWSGRSGQSLQPQLSTVFSGSTSQPAADVYPRGSCVELSTQLQAWMTLEAAARLRQTGAALPLLN